MMSHIKRAKLFGQFDIHQPDIVAITGTWLDPSFAELAITNYVVVSRRDRPQSDVSKMNHGNIANLAYNTHKQWSNSSGRLVSPTA